MAEVLEFPLSLEQAVARLQRENRPGTRDLESEKAGGSRSWDLNTSFPEAVELAERGWKEPIHQVEAYLTQVQHLVREAWGSSLDVAGECVDVGAFLEGSPECMLSFTVPETRAIRVVASISARCDADAPRLLNRGIAIAAAVYALQCAGTPVSLAVGDWVTPSGHGSGRDVIHGTTVEVNPFGDYIDAGRLAFWLGHPAALRRCMFRFQEQLPEEIRDEFGFRSGGGYGRPADLPIDEGSRRDVIYLPFPPTESLADYQTPEKAFQTIRKLFAQSGVNLQLRE